MLNLFRTLFAPLCSLFFMMMGSGLFNTFTSLRLEMEGISSEKIGIVTAALYAGILAGSLKIDRYISRVGHVLSFITFASCLAVCILAQSLWLNPWFWSLLRFFSGICMGGVFIVIESWFLMKSPKEMRGQALSLYLGVLYFALSGGQLLIDFADPTTVYPFCLIALFLILSIIPIAFQKKSQPVLAKDSVRLKFQELIRLSPLGFLGGLISGMVLAITYGLIPIFAKEMGMSVSEVGSFMAVIIFGGFLFQWPVGKWADLQSRRKVIKWISFASAFLSLLMGVITHYWLLFGLAFFFGGFAFTLYPVSMAYTCENVKENEIVAATGGFVLSYGIGAIAGPVLAPIGMQCFGLHGLFYFLALISLILGVASFFKPYCKTSTPDGSS